MTVPRFWREIPQRYTLQAARCGECEATYFPPRAVCPTCRRASIGRMEPVQLAGSGRILEWTRVHRGARGYERQVPYLLAWVQTDEGPVLTGQVVDWDGDLEPGQRVKAVFRRLGEDGAAGVIHYGTKWALESPAPSALEEEE